MDRDKETPPESSAGNTVAGNDSSASGVDNSTHGAYCWGEWSVTLEIEQTDYFEDQTPPHFVFYADVWHKGAYFGRIDVVTQIEIRGWELWFTHFDIHGLERGAAGRACLNAIAHAAMEDNNVEAIVIEGGTRTTGLRRGKKPRQVRFGRRPDPESES